MVSVETESSSDSPVEQLTEPQNKIICDYLVVGAGTACLSFVDTVLELRKDVTFVIVDRNSAPGGHWTKAYPFVRLHQPSCYYGVNSVPLGHLDKNGTEPFDLNERATGKEICEYYQEVVEKFKSTGRVRIFFETNYEGEAENVDKSISETYKDVKAKITHTITSKNGEVTHIDCTKVVRCESNVQVPSMRKSFPFEIDESVVKAIIVNDLSEHIGSKSPHDKYLILGGGKTSVDAITYMIEDGNVRPDQITWVVPRPTWFLMRDHLNPSPKPGKRFWKDGTNFFIKPIITGKSGDEVFLELEKLGSAQRVDPNDPNFPTTFKGATLDSSEMKHLRSIKNVVKNKGRVTSITEKEVIFANGAHSIPFSATDTIVVDCTAHDTYGYLNFDKDFKFFNPHRIRLGPLTSFLNPSHTSAQVGFLEAQYADTSSGDDVKNSFLFYTRGPDELDSGLRYLMLNWYAQVKTDLAFDICPNYRAFVLAARTDRQNPNHHGGILGLLWAIFGPLKLLHKTQSFVYKMENGWYADFPTHPLPGRSGPDASKLQANLRNPPKVKPKKLKPSKKLQGDDPMKIRKKRMHFARRRKTTLTVEMKW